MAVNAKFVADFASFEAAVAKSQVSLRSFEQDANKVEKSLNRMADSFSGQKVIQDATLMTAAIDKVGGASTLTATEMARVNTVVNEAIAKYRALGQTAPKSMTDLANATKSTETATESWAGSLGKLNSLLGAFGIGLSVGAVVAFSRSLLTMGDEIVRVADRTGLTTDEVQKLSYVAGQSGNTIDELTQAIGQMQNRLSSGDKSAVASVKELGINFAALSAAAPAKQLEMIATEIAKIPDPADRTRIAMDLFGKAGTAILPTLTSQFARLADEAPRMSDATVRALDSAGDQLGRFGLQIKVWAAESYIFLRSGFDRLIAVAYNASAAFIDVEAKLVTLIQKIPGGTKAMAALGVSVEDLAKGAQWFRDAAKGMAPPLEVVTEKAKQLAPAMKDIADHTDRAAPAMGKLKDEVIAFVGPIEDVNFWMYKWTTGVGSLSTQIPNLTKHIEEQAQMLQELRDELEPLASTTIPQMSGGVADLGHEFTGPLPSGIEKTTAKVGALKTAFNSVESILGNVQTKFAQTSTVLVRMADAMIQKFGTGDWIGGIVAGVAGGIQLITSLFTNAEKQINKTRAAFVDAAGGLDMLRDKATAAGVTINELLNAKNVKQYEEAIRKLNEAFEEHQADIDLAKQLIDEYGLSVDQLGPKWKAQQLTEQSETLLNKLRVMVDVLGLSMPDALVVMKEKFQAAFDTALKFGIELPSQMQPVLEKLVEMGQLIDENGEVVTDLQDTGITFSESFSKSVDRLITKFDEFLQKIGLIPAAIANVPTTHNTHFTFTADPLPDVGGAATGGFVTSSGVQHFARGGRVLAFRPRGTDTVPAMLTPGEGVLNVAAVQRLGRGGLAALNRGESPASAAGGSDLADELRGLRQELLADRLNAPQKIARAVRDEVQKMGRRR
jgi:hypothetical protein